MPALERSLAIKLLLASVAGFSAAAVPALATEWSDGETKIAKTLGDLAGEFAKASDRVTPFTKALAAVVGKAKNIAETVSDKSLIDPAMFEQLDKDRRAMDDVMPPVLPSLNSPGAYKAMVGDIETPATYESGQEELRTLNKVEAERTDTISKMKSNRNSLQTVATRYKTNADTAAKIGEGLDKIVQDNPMIDVAFSFTGVNGYFSITALAWDAEIVPAFYDRAAAAENAMKRYNVAIKAVESDLQTFHSLKSAFRRMYGLDPTALDTQALNPGAIDMNPGAVGKLAAAANAATAHAKEVAGQMQKEAADIAKHNAEISRIQQFLGLMRAATEVGNAAAERPAAPSTTTTVINNDNRKFYFKIVPGEYLQNERRRQIPIDTN